MPRYLSGSARERFQIAAWEFVRQIPAGRVSTYGRIGDQVSISLGNDPTTHRAFAARWVGGAMAACPDDVPWHRVINAQGRISAREGAERQRALLEAEGIEFDSRDRVDLKRFAWPVVD